MQEVAYDALGEHVARRSVPVSETTPEAQLLNDLYQYDAMGREVRHTLPWNAAVTTAYDGLTVSVTDPLMNTTTVDQDALGRAVTTTDAMGAGTTYTYGPFGSLHTVTTPGGALTVTTRDAFGRVRQLDDPDRGTTTSTNDGFGELVTSTDALGRTVTYTYDALGRTTSRLDKNGAESLATTWVWDMAPHGLGKLASLTSPDGTKTYSYTALGQLQSFTLAVNGESDTLSGTLGYDTLGRVATVTYPSPSGTTGLALAQDYDPFGHVVTVRDSTTSFPYWRLTDVDSAGRYKTETLGNGATSTRAYYADKQGLESIVTQSGGTTVQNLAYDYDARRDLTSRSDMLQSQTERFRYDPVRRLTCAYFSAVENDNAPCATSYGYDPSGNGNLVAKSGVGTLSYTDPKHPHAVTSAGSNTFGYDAAGNQTSRPDGATLTYTPFDLPKTITQPSGTVSFDYDGDEQGIRKTSPTTETLYFADLYERVTTAAPATTAHKFYVHSPERVVAVVTQGSGAATEYVHVDHLGSVDVLTDATGAVSEHRSYDPFGQRRNPTWGQPPPASFPNLTDVGFTGQEDDSEFGLVNMKGRMYDPGVGRFLSVDPHVQEPLSAQSWNPYSYVKNNPLNYVDPSGFDETPPQEPPYVPGTRVSWGTGVDACIGCPLPKQELTVSGTTVAVVVGAATRPVDVGTTGTTSKDPPQPVTTAPRDWTAHPAVRIGIGIVKAAYGFAVSISETGTLSSQVHTGMAVVQNAASGAHADGVLGGVAGAVNTLNPFYALGVAGAETKIGVEKGDWERAAAGGATGVLIVLSAIVGGRGGGAGEGAGAATVDVADTAAIRLPETNGIGFPTFEAFKEAFGSFWPQFEWHHIVEHNGAGGENARAFPPEQIHNTNNLIPVEQRTHRAITEYYRWPNKNDPRFEKISPREWLRGQSWEAQHAFGLEVLRDHGVIQ